MKFIFKSIIEENRSGTFDIPRSFFRREPDAVMSVMSKMAIVRCESLELEDAFRYIAYSPLFEPANAEYECPKYTIIITKNDKSFTVQAIKDGN